MRKRAYISSFAKKVWSREGLAVFFVIAFALLSLLIVTKIPVLAADEEIQSVTQSSSVQEIFEHPVNAPYKLITLVATSISPSVRAARAVSFVIFVVTIFAFYYTLKHWHTIQVSALTTLLFCTNSVALAIGRLGTPLITVFYWFIFTALGLWQLHSRSNKLLPFIVLITFAILLYTPGALWFSVVLLIIYRKRLMIAYKHVKKSAVIIGAGIALVVMSPLIYSFVQDVSNIKQWLLLPDTLMLGNIPRNILRVPSAFIFRMPDEPLITVGRLPIFDLASGILFLIGCNAYRQKLSLDRTKIMIGMAIMGIIIGALGQLLMAIALTMPFAFSVIGAGIEFLIDEWQAVFPKNPFAKSFGSLLVSIAVLFGSYYHLTRFFVVWPQNPNTRAVYNNSRQIHHQ